MKSILILSNSSVGLYNFRNELILKLLEQNRVIISIPDEIKANELKEEGCEIIVTPINRRGMNPREDGKLFLAYRRLLKQVRPDVVLTYTIKPNIYGGLASRILKIPYIVTITGLGSTFQREGFLKDVVVRMYRTALKRADCIFFQNEGNKKVFEQYHILGKKERLVNGSGVNLEKHPYEEYPEGDIVRLLFVGRIMKEKGIDEFLEAARVLHTDKIVFEVLGGCDEDYIEVIKEYVKKGIISYHGFQKDVHQYYKAASVLVLPTYYFEGMSNVLMEASATGRPVITSNINGCREVYEEGVTGLCCETKNSANLICVIKRFLALRFLERAKMGCNARIKMEREFNRANVTAAYVEEIDKILGKKQ